MIKAKRDDILTPLSAVSGIIERRLHATDPVERADRAGRTEPLLPGDRHRDQITARTALSAAARQSDYGRRAQAGRHPARPCRTAPI
jgi:hypothetical protein